jgi:hypothetical protein
MLKDSERKETNVVYIEKRESGQIGQVVLVEI